MGDYRALPERTTLGVCPICGDHSMAECAGTPSAPHQMVEAVDVEYVRADLHRGAVAERDALWRELEACAEHSPDKAKTLADAALSLRAARGGR